MKTSRTKHEGRTEKTATAAAVDVLGAAGERGVRDTEPPLPDPSPGLPPPPSRGDPLPDPGVDEVILSAKRSSVLLSFHLANTLFKVLKKKKQNSLKNKHA